MLLTPLPVTALYRDHQKRGLLRTELPLQEWHGQTKLAYRHPAFAADEPEMWMKRAFRQDYETNSSSMLRMVETAIRGYEYLSSLQDRDACLEARRQQFAKQARIWRLILPAVEHHAVNETERRRARELSQRARRLFGLRAWERFAGFGTIVLSKLWKLRLELRGDGIQPKTIVTRYRAKSKATEDSHRTLARSSHQLPPAAAVSKLG